MYHTDGIGGTERDRDMSMGRDFTAQLSLPACLYTSTGRPEKVTRSKWQGIILEYCSGGSLNDYLQVNGFMEEGNRWMAAIVFARGISAGLTVRIHSFGRLMLVAIMMPLPLVQSWTVCHNCNGTNIYVMR
jgi:hypothetical protein